MAKVSKRTSERISVIERYKGKCQQKNDDRIHFWKKRKIKVTNQT